MPTPKTTKLYDCDNTLVLTEKVAFDSGFVVVNELLATYGVSHHFSPDGLERKWAGRTFRDIVGQLAAQFGFAISDPDVDEWVEREKQAAIAAFRQGLEECAGAKAALQRASGRFRMAVVSSSAKDRILVTLEEAGLSGVFADECIFSAQSSLAIPTGKPAPDIYIYAVQAMGLTAEECIAFEDTTAGVTAARAAGIDVVGYLGCYEPADQKSMGELLTAAGASALMLTWDQEEEVLARLTEAERIS